MPTKADKPYKVYRQGRPARGDGGIPWADHHGRGRGSGPKPPRRNRTGWRLFRWLRRILYVALVVVAVIGGIAYWSFHQAVEERNALVPPDAARALSPADGPMLATAHNVLLIGTDTRADGERGRSDTLMLLRMDIPRRRYAILSIPRDLRVPVPGYGEEKVNSAFANGGEALTIRTVESFTGVDVHHYMLIDFEGFKGVVNALGGITVDNPRAIVSAPFDGREWRFGKGEIQLDGTRALAYARVRNNRLDPNESDLSRGVRQQRVINGIIDEVVSLDSVLNPTRAPSAVVQPLITDVSAEQMVAMAFGKVWAKDDNVLACRLGGDAEFVDGQAVIIGNEQNPATVRMWLGDQAPRKPQVSVNPFAPGCVRRSG